MILYRYERLYLDYIEKLFKGKYSCKGMILFLEVNVYYFFNFKFVLLGCIVCFWIYEVLFKYMKYYWLCLGVGMICLDFKGVYILLDGVVILMGKSSNFISGYISFLYNEYFLFWKFNMFYC